MAETLEFKVKTDNDVAICRREMKTATPSINPSFEVTGDELANLKLSRAQAHWLAIGEKIGTWLVKIKTRLSA